MVAPDTKPTGIQEKSKIPQRCCWNQLGPLLRSYLLPFSKESKFPNYSLFCKRWPGSSWVFLKVTGGWSALVLPGGKWGQPWMPQHREATKCVSGGCRSQLVTLTLVPVPSNASAASTGNAGYTARLKAYAKSLSPFSYTGYQPARCRA